MLFLNFFNTQPLLILIKGWKQGQESHSKYPTQLSLQCLNLIHTYPFLLQIESLEHCDFLSLRDMLIRTHLQDLKERTSDTLYENYRCLKLSSCCKNASHVSYLLVLVPTTHYCQGHLTTIAQSMDYGRPMKPFFIEIPNFWA